MGDETFLFWIVGDSFRLGIATSEVVVFFLGGIIILPSMAISLAQKKWLWRQVCHIFTHTFIRVSLYSGKVQHCLSRFQTCSNFNIMLLNWRLPKFYDDVNYKFRRFPFHRYLEQVTHLTSCGSIFTKSNSLIALDVDSHYPTVMAKHDIQYTLAKLKSLFVMNLEISLIQETSCILFDSSKYTIKRERNLTI